MATDRESIELAFNIELETRRAMGAISKIDKQLRKTVSSKLQIKAFDGKSIREFNKQLVHSRSNLRAVTFSMSPAQRKKFGQNFKEMSVAYKKLTKTVTQEQTKIQKLQRLMRKTENKEEKDELKKQIELQKKASIKKIHTQQRGYSRARSSFGRKLVTSGTSAHLEKRADQARAAKEFVEGIKSHKTGAELAEGFKDAVSAMSSKDIFGLAKAGTRMGGSILKGLAKVSMAKGAGISAKGAEMGGGMGAALKGLGGAMKGISPLLGVLSRVGTLMGAIAGPVMALVKLFLDADAAVKEMNKTVLEGGSSWDTYAASGRNVDAGMDHLDKSLRRLRDETTDLEMNKDMGTTAKDHQQVINTLEREGITLENLTKSYAHYTDISKQSIVYSRLFGVSVDEIAQMQAEMMQQMGAGLNDLGKEFDMIGRAAEDSGIAQNKFFAMLRGVSSDLALYGVRIGETTKMLGQLGKVMSPRTAQKFLGEFAKGFQGKSIQDRLRAMLLGGPGAVKAVQNSISEQIKDLVSKVKDAVPNISDEDAMSLLAGHGAAGTSLKKLEKGGKVQGAGAMIEAFQNLQMASKQAKQGVYGAAQASEMVGGYGAYKAQKAALRIGGAKSFTQASMMGAPGHTAAILASQGSEDQLKANIGIERAIEQQRNDLVDAVNDPDGEKDVITVLKKLKKYDEKAAMSDKNYLKNQVKSMSEDDLWKSLDKKSADDGKSQAEKDAESMRKMGALQGQRTQGMLEKLDLIFDTLYNYIYGIMTDIYSALKFGGDLQKKIYKSGNKELIQAWGKSGGDEAKFMGELANSATGKKMGGVLASDKQEDAVKKGDLEKLISSKFDSGSALAVDQLFRAMKEQKLTAAQQEAVTTGMHKGGGLRQGVKEAGLTAQQEAAIFAKVALWGTQASTRADIIEDASKILGIGGGPSVTSDTTALASPASAAPTGQQAAAAKSENPGTGGAAVPVAAPSPAASAATPAGGSFFSQNASPVQLPDEQKMSEAVMDQVDFTGGSVVNSLQDLWKAMRMKGIKLDKVQLKGEYQEVIYKGAQRALFEYALYTAQDPADTLKKMKDSGFGGLGGMVSDFQKQQDQAAANKQDTLVGKAHAAGGIVTGISGGLANINPAPGEGLTSIGRGERILPAGAGGGGAGDIHIHVDGIGGADLANFLKTKVAQGVHEYKRREKFN